MSFLVPLFLWLIIPLVILLLKSPKNITLKTHILILILLLFALARPVQKEILQESNINAHEVIIALDVSYSMQATDISPSRYLFAKETIRHLLLYNQTDNIMLIAFTSNPLLLSPPSTDHALIAQALEGLNTENILTKGTSLKKLFTKLTSLRTTPKTLILITDGGEERDIKRLVQILKHSNISLVTLALGSQKGTTLLKKDGSVLKDKEQNLVITYLNPLLALLTQQLNGTYLTASNSPDKTAAAIDAALKRDKRVHQVKKKEYRYKEYYQIPLILATLLFLLLHTRAIKYLVTLFAFLGLSLEASWLDSYYLYQSYQSYHAKSYKKTKHYLKLIDLPSLQSQILLANTYYKEGAYKKAIEIYNSIQSTSAAIKQQLYYNTANAYVFLHQYTKAKIYYLKALQLGFDADALHNLKRIIFLEDKTSSPLGKTHPKSQSSQTNTKKHQHKEEEKNEENTPNNTTNSGAQASSKERQKNKKQEKHLFSNKPQKQPLSSKVYELINKGYIYETHPW